MDWRHRAACRDEEPELFFPIGDVGPSRRQIAEAKAICGRCPVREECLGWALGVQSFGIAGGLTEGEINELRVKRGLPRPTVTPPTAPTTRERAAAGRELLRAGAAPAQVAAELEVSLRTAERWAERVRAEDAELVGADR